MFSTRKVTSSGVSCGSAKNRPGGGVVMIFLLLLRVQTIYFLRGILDWRPFGLVCAVPPGRLDLLFLGAVCLWPFDWADLSCDCFAALPGGERVLFLLPGDGMFLLLFFGGCLVVVEGFGRTRRMIALVTPP